MDITAGFRIDDPAVFVPWAVSVPELLDLFSVTSGSSSGLRKVTKAYYTISGTALGLNTMIGFHVKRNKLEQFELFDPTQKDLYVGYDRYQSALVREFGQPTKLRTYGDIPPAHEWNISNHRILHFAQERFGPESHLRILAPGSQFSYDPFART